jgi:hypothetical protein
VIRAIVSTRAHERAESAGTLFSCALTGQELSLSAWRS